MIPNKGLIAPSVELNSIQTDRFKTETLSITISIPKERSESLLFGLLLALLKRGTEKFPTIGHINRRLDELYAASASSRLDRFGPAYALGFSAELLDECYTDGAVDIFDGALEVITQMMFHPLTDEKGLFLSHLVESEKEIVCDLIRSSINNPKTYAAIRCREILFEKETNGVTIAESLKRVGEATPESLTDLYRALIERPFFRVFYIGSKSREQVEQKVMSRLAPYLSAQPAAKPVPEASPAVSVTCRHVDEKTEAAQGKLVIGLRTGVRVSDPDFYATLVFNEIYGGSPVSKLFMNVRERLSLCYYCSASYEIYRGVIFVSCGVDPEKRDEAEGEIFRQLEEIRGGRFTQGEFDAAIKSLVSNYRSLSDMPANVESFYGGRDLFGIDCTIDQCIEGIRSVTRENVIRAAEQIVADTVFFLWGDLAEEDEDDE